MTTKTKTKTKAKTKAKAKAKNELVNEAEYKKIVGYAWEKHTKNGKPCLTIKLEGINYLAVRNLNPVNPRKSPSYWLRYQLTSGEWLQVGALWNGKNKEGNGYLWLKMDKTYILLPNKRKMTEKSPDYIIKLSYLNARGTTPFYTTLTISPTTKRKVKEDAEKRKAKAQKKHAEIRTLIEKDQKERKTKAQK